MIPAWAHEWGRGVRRRIATRDVPEEVKRLVDEREGGRHCVDCRRLGLVTPASEGLELDHRQPLARGGDSSAFNLIWRCRGHNRSKGARKHAQEVPPWARGPRR